jgi:hypothetical protein
MAVWGEQWICACGTHNLSLRPACRDCKTQRPADAQTETAEQVMTRVVAAGCEGRLQPDGFELVRPDTYRHIYEVLNDISHDGGAGAGHDHYAIDAKWEPRCADWDFKLSFMTREQRQTFAIGEQSEGRELAERHGLLDMAEMLDVFADGEVSV